MKRHPSREKGEGGGKWRINKIYSVSSLDAGHALLLLLLLVLRRRRLSRDCTRESSLVAPADYCR